MHLHDDFVETSCGKLFYISNEVYSEKAVFNLSGWGSHPDMALPLSEKLKDYDICGLYYPGLGKSVRLRSDFTQRDLCECVYGFVQKHFQHTKEIHLVTSSLGAALGFYLINREPRIKTLFCLCPCVKIDPSKITATEFFVIYEAIENLLLRRSRLKDLLEGEWKAKSWNFILKHRHVLRTMFEPEITERLKAIPTEIIYGSHDRSMPFDSQKKYFANFKNVKFLELKGNHHITDSNEDFIVDEIIRLIKSV